MYIVVTDKFAVIYQLPMTCSRMVEEIKEGEILKIFPTNIPIVGWYKVKTSDNEIGFIQKDSCGTLN